VKQCRKGVLELMTLMIDLEDKPLVVVTQEHRNKIKYICSPCKPESNKTPWVLACKWKAIKCSWNFEK